MQVIKGMHPSRDVTKRKRYIVLLVRSTIIDDSECRSCQMNQINITKTIIIKMSSDISKVIKIEFPLTEHLKKNDRHRFHQPSYEDTAG